MISNTNCFVVHFLMMGNLCICLTACLHRTLAATPSPTNSPDRLKQGEPFLLSTVDYNNGNFCVAADGQPIQLPDGVPASYPGCAAITEYPSTPFEVPIFRQPFSQAPIKQKAGPAACNADSCMDIYEFEERYVSNYRLGNFPDGICPGGTKMLLYDGVFPSPTVVQPLGRQV